jgi:serine protein kinase
MEARRFLTGIGGEVKESFAANRMILSFEQYLDGFHKAPRAHARNAAQYLKDVLDYFGEDQVQTPGGKQRRFRLFDLPFDEGGRVARVAGQEEVQNAIYRILGNFVRTGRVNKLILLHGPNGSAKSSIVSALFRGTEAYSRTPEGAMYRFNWVFPSEKKVKGGGTVGFGGKGGAEGELATFAHLEGESLEARLTCPLKDHPLFLVPRADRRAMLDKHCRPANPEDGEGEFVLSEYLTEGELCQFCRQIHDALLAHYGGDYLKVLRHVQVERFHVS